MASFHLTGREAPASRPRGLRKAGSPAAEWSQEAPRLDLPRTGHESQKLVQVDPWAGSGPPEDRTAPGTQPRVQMGLLPL